MMKIEKEKEEREKSEKEIEKKDRMTCGRLSATGF